MANRTIINAQINTSIWPIVETWAKERDYRQVATGENWRRYQQGYGILVAPKMMEFSQVASNVVLQGWVRINIINRIFTLFMMPAEMDLGSGFRGSIPRNTARRDLNLLLQRLGVPTFR
jgi:hypothetical protein